MFMQRHNPVLSLKLLCYNVICLLCFPFLPLFSFWQAFIPHTCLLVMCRQLPGDWPQLGCYGHPLAADWIDTLLCCPFHNTHLPVLFMKCSNLFRSLVTVQYFDLFELQTLSLNCACYLVIKVEVIYSCICLILPSVWFKEQNGRKLKLAGMLQEKLQTRALKIWFCFHGKFSCR